MAEWNCGIEPTKTLMEVFEAALGPLKPGIQLALNPDIALDIDWAENYLDDAIAISIPGAAMPLVLVEVIKVAIDLPPLPTPFSVGSLNLPTFDPSLNIDIGAIWGLPQIKGLGGLLEAMIMIPIQLMINLFENPGMSFSFPDIIIDILALALPDMPKLAIENLAGCMAGVIGPIFGL